MRRIALLNRGEPAVRFLRTLREVNAARPDDARLEVVAFVTDPDAGAPFALDADDVVRLGPAQRTSADGRRVSAYCDHQHVLAALERAGCDAVWPGWGFASEDATFVAALEARGITFIGPPAEAMRKLGDKIAAKQLAELSGVPLAPWWLVPDGEALDEGALRAAGDRIGYPLMVKASAGGGGRGIRRVERAEDLAAAVAGVREEVARAFGEGGVFLEKCLTGARHIEVQLVVGADGAACALGLRDCSVQRRNQKVVEEAPATIVPPEMVDTLKRSSERLAEQAGYRGVGTAEFLYDPATGRAAFLEVNARLQVEHTVTEAVTGVDLVAAQLDIAEGRPWLDGPVPTPRGHAIEVRLNAEDPEHGFRPSPGLLRTFKVPSGPGVRVDSGVVAGMTIAPDFDSMIAKIIVHGPSRAAALARLERALRELQVVVEDGATNRGFLLDLVRHEALVAQRIHTAWLDGFVADGLPRHADDEAEALLCAAVIGYRLTRDADRARFFAMSELGIPQQLPEPDGLDVELRLRGAAHRLHVHHLGGDRYLAGPPGQLELLALAPRGDHAAILVRAGRRERVLYSLGRTGIQIDLDGRTHLVERSSGGVVRAPAPAMVVHVAVEEGQRVAIGDRLATVEAMKMEMPITAPEAGVVRSVVCRPHQSVAAGEALFHLEAEATEASGGDDAAPLVLTPTPDPLAALIGADGRPDPARFAALSARQAASVCAAAAATARAVVLGYDAEPTRVERLLALLERDDLSALGEPSAWREALGLLDAFVATAGLLDRNLPALSEGAAGLPPEHDFYEFCRHHHDGPDAAPEAIRPLLTRALRAYGLNPETAAGPAVREALFRIAIAHRHGRLRQRLVSGLVRLATALHEGGPRAPRRLWVTLERLATLAPETAPAVVDRARQAIYALFARPRFLARRQELEAMLDAGLATTADADAVRALARSPYDLVPMLMERACGARSTRAAWALVQRLYVTREVRPLEGPAPLGEGAHAATYALAGDGGETSLALVCSHGPSLPTAPTTPLVEWLVTGDAPLDGLPVPPQAAPGVRRLTATWLDEGRLRHATWRPDEAGALVEDARLRDVHPETARRVGFARLEAFELERLPTPERLVAWRARAKANPRDERLLVFAEVFELPRALTGERDPDQLWELERAFFESLRVIREAQADRPAKRRLRGHRLKLFLRSPVRADAEALRQLGSHFEAPTRGLGLEKVVMRMELASPEDGSTRTTEFVARVTARHRLELSERAPSDRPLSPMTPYRLAVQRARRLGTFYPYEIARMLEGRDGTPAPHPDLRRGRFVEHELDEAGALVPIERAPGQNPSGVVVGLMSHRTRKHPEGLERVWIASDPTKAMGALAEPECRRILAALDLAEARELPVEWLPVSAGARIALDSGTENLDWTARVLRRIVEFTARGGVIHVIVAGINVGAQSYWNAEATMLMHTRGVLIMTPDASMVLTGKRALEYSGSVAAEDERGIGGVERIMGPNGQAQYFARDLGEAYAVLFEHYRFTYRAPGEACVRRHETTDPADRSVLGAPYRGEGFATLGEIFDEATNPGRKKPFAIREVMAGVVDADGGTLERWRWWREAETAVVWDAHVGGEAVTVIAVESQPLVRRGRVPLDGPDSFSGGTLFPQSSRKIARALRAASGVRPAVVLANLSGFDGSPESLRQLQLEFGAEIGRAVVEFDGPLIFVVIGRYHGGAYVVFSKALNPELEALALEGAFASVIGGAPAAAVVLPREVRRRAEADPRVVALRAQLDRAAPAARARLRERLEAARAEALLDKQGELAREFDAIHSVERAVQVGSLDAVIAPAELRSAIVERLQAARARRTLPELKVAGG